MPVRIGGRKHGEGLGDSAFLKDRPKKLWVLLVGCSGAAVLSELSIRELRGGETWGLGLWGGQGQAWSSAPGVGLREEAREWMGGAGTKNSVEGGRVSGII